MIILNRSMYNHLLDMEYISVNETLQVHRICEPVKEALSRLCVFCFVNIGIKYKIRFRIIALKYADFMNS